MTHGRVERDEVDLATAGGGHASRALGGLELLFTGARAAMADASSSKWNHSAAISTSRCAFTNASRLSRSRSVSFPCDSMKCRTAREMNWLLLPFVATRSRTASVLSGRTMLMRLLICLLECTDRKSVV